MAMLAVACGIGATNSAWAALWSNPITGTNPSTYNPYTTGQTVASDLTVSGIFRGSGITANAGSDRYNATSWTTSTSLDSNDYFGFTLTPNDGFRMDLTSFVYTAQRSGSGPSSFAFRSSLDSFAANIGTPTSTGTTIDLSSVSYQDVSSAITFRLYGFNSAGGTFSVNDFTFNGSMELIPVPEPITWAMLSFGTLFGGLQLRRYLRSRSG